MLVSRERLRFEADDSPRHFVSGFPLIEAVDSMCGFVFGRIRD